MRLNFQISLASSVILLAVSLGVEAANVPPFAVSSGQAVHVQNNNVYGKWHSSAMGGAGYMQNVVCCPIDVRHYYSYKDVGGVYRSDDGGQNWWMMHDGTSLSLSSYQVRGLVVDPCHADKLIMAVGNH